MNDSPNRQSPTNHSSTPSRTNARSNNSNHMNHQSTNSNHQTNNGNGSPHSPLSNDSIGNYDGISCDSLRNNINLGSPGFDGGMLNGSSSGNGINDIMLGGGLGSDSSSKLITSSSAALQTSLMTSQTSPMHLNSQTTSSIPEIVFSGEHGFEIISISRKAEHRFLFSLQITRQPPSSENSSWITSLTPPSCRCSRVISSIRRLKIALDVIYVKWYGREKNISFNLLRFFFRHFFLFVICFKM
jgi:hypothetical protein